MLSPSLSRIIRRVIRSSSELEREKFRYLQPNSKGGHAGRICTSLAPLLYKSGAREVHIRPACPPLLFGCKYLNFSRSSSELDLITRRIIREREGDNITSRLLADYADPDSRNYLEMVEEIRKRLNFTTLKYHRLDDLIASIGLPADSLCTYCWNGKE